jgi:hypothetical protein
VCVLLCARTTAQRNNYNNNNNTTTMCSRAELASELGRERERDGQVTLTHGEKKRAKGASRRLPT